MQVRALNSVRQSAPQLQGLVPYDPKYLPARAYLSANENPRDVETEIRQKIISAIRKVPLNRYPDPLANDLRDMIVSVFAPDIVDHLAAPQCPVTGAGNAGQHHQVRLFGFHGGDELLFNIALAWGGPGRKFLNLPPTFSVYAANARLTGTEVIDVPRLADYSIDEETVLKRVGQGDIDYVIVASPNNPTGKLANEEFLDATDALVLVDEAYFEFSRTTMRPYLAMHKNLLILRTFSKAFSLAGVRMGYILGNAEVIREFLKVRQPYSVDAVSQAIAREVFSERQKFERGIMAIISERDRLLEELGKVPGITVYPSDSNYILFKLEGADKVWEALYARGILVRDFSHAPMLENCLRVSVGTEEENDEFLAALREIVANK